MDGQILERIGALVRQFSRPATLLSARGHDLLRRGMDVEELPLLPRLTVTRRDQLALMPSEAQPDAVWAIAADQEGAEQDLLLTLEAFLRSLKASEPEQPDPMAGYRHLLLDSLQERELAETLATHNIERRRARCVLLIETDDGWHDDAATTLTPVLPMEPGDTLVPMDRHSAAFIKDLSAMGERSDLIEYAEALQDTVLSEAGCPLRIGVGGGASDAVGLHASYKQARQALALGRTFMPAQSVLDYQRMLMPRLLSELPVPLAEAYHRLLFNAETERLFTDEMLETVNAFFDKDLNLSDAARQLYIHRNTLTYRLDKIARSTGLDLRRFEDAVTFKMLMEMKKCLSIPHEI